MAKGSRRPRSLLLAGTQFLCFGEYLLYKGGDIYSMNSVEVIEVFYKIRTDLDKLKYSAYITKIINDVTDENQNCYKIMQLFLNTLYVISEADKDLDFVASIFRLRLLSIIGFKPEINQCVNCRGGLSPLQTSFAGDPDFPCPPLKYFSIKNSGLKCDVCGKQDKSSIEILESTKDAVRYIILSDSKKIFSFDIPAASKKELEIISKLYLTEKLEKEYRI